MSHIVGTVQVVSPALVIGPDSGAASTSANTWGVNFASTPAPGGTRFVILHFRSVALPGNNRLEVDLGYGTDVFHRSDGSEFWTRPIDVYVLPGGLVPVRYITQGAVSGGVTLDQYGRGERHAGEVGHPSFSNCDPFLRDASYAEPVYDPFWFCQDPPNWENVRCVPAGDIRALVARSAGMIVTVETSDVSGTLQVSTCSVTLVDTDKVLTAGHCHRPAEAQQASVTFDYETACGGGRLLGYSPIFHKVKAVIAQRYDGTSGGYDYSLLQLETAPVGLPVIQMRHDLPMVGEQIFGIHHPNGAVKKLSVPHPGFAAVTGSGPSSVTVPSTFHVSGGSSGSGLYDTSGRIVGVLSNGDPCHNGALSYFPTASIMTAIMPAPPIPISRDVMVVFDRSGSMAQLDSVGRAKIDAARDALSLFVQLVRTGTGNRIGLVSFSTAASSPVDFAISSATTTNKKALIGPAPFDSGKVGSLAPGGATSIGEGLDAARAQFATSPGANPRAILLFTDGMENTPRMVGQVEGALAGIDVHAIGFGTSANIDDGLLASLAGAHSGLYTRAESGLSLEKFFSHAFGNIFEAGLLRDPELSLAAGQSTGAPQTFNVCGEDALTVVAGWEDPAVTLELEVTTPGGTVITAATAGVASAVGRTWTFLRITLPQGTERDGLWSARVLRPAERGEFARQGPTLAYFVNVIPTGGPKLTPARDSKHYYTGDAINPMVVIRYPDGTWPPNTQVQATVTRPAVGEGNLLRDATLGPPLTSDGDTIPARQATLGTLEQQAGHPIVTYTTDSLDLSSDSIDTQGSFEAAGLLGKQLIDYLTIEGTYSFHYTATYGQSCTATRELVRSIRVDVGIDPTQTTATTVPLGVNPDGTTNLRTTLTPRDRYGNYLGPGQTTQFTVTGQPGTNISGPTTDNGDGTYSIDLTTTQHPAKTPGVIIIQPGRPPITVSLPRPPDEPGHIYSVKFVCGTRDGHGCNCQPLAAGHYATEINIHNPHNRHARLIEHLLPVVQAGAPAGRAPNHVGTKARRELDLPAHTATMEDCCSLTELLLDAPPTDGPSPLYIGILEIRSNEPLEITAVYTTNGPGGTSTSIDVQHVSDSGT